MNKQKILIIIFLIFSISAVYAERELAGELKGVNNPEMMVSDGESLYVLDGIIVNEYDLKNLKLKNRFGKRGNGPGEFQTDFMNKLRIRLIEDKIMLSNFNKIAFFSKTGKFIKEIRLPFGASHITSVGENLLITRFITGEKGINQMGVVLYSQDLKQIKTLYTKPEITVERSRRLNAPNAMIFVFYDKNIYIADQSFFKILVFDDEGNKTREIKRDYPVIPITEQYKTEVYQWFESLWLSRFKAFAESRNLTKETMKKMIYFHDVFPAFRSISLIEDVFCIETFIKKGNKSKFILIDKKDKDVKNIWLTDPEPGRVKMMAKFTYTFSKGFYYYFKENIENDSWELFKEPLK